MGLCNTKLGDWIALPILLVEAAFKGDRFQQETTEKIRRHSATAARFPGPSATSEEYEALRQAQAIAFSKGEGSTGCIVLPNGDKAWAHYAFAKPELWEARITRGEALIKQWFAMPPMPSPRVVEVERLRPIAGGKQAGLPPMIEAVPLKRIR